MWTMSTMSRWNRETNAYISTVGIPKESWGDNKIDPELNGSQVQSPAEQRPIFMGKLLWRIDCAAIFVLDTRVIVGFILIHNYIGFNIID